MNIMKQKRRKKNYGIELNNLGEEIEPVAFIVGILKVYTQKKKKKLTIQKI